jgi:hypothetical protein
MASLFNSMLVTQPGAGGSCALLLMGAVRQSSWEPN